MDFIGDIAVFVKDNWGQLVVVIGLAVGLAEAVVKLTPTKKDDGAVQRIGLIITYILRWIPSNIKKTK